MQSGRLKRRDVIALLGGAAAWPLAARTQGERMRRVAVLWGGTDREGDPRSHPYSAAFLQALQQLGWTDGRNVRIDYRWPAGDADKARKYAAELVALAPEVILASGTMSVAALQALSRTLPIVFAAVADPAGAGFVESLATQAATRLASCFMNTVGAGRCLNSSGRSHRT
jgi:ABC transporter substrate binding protein